MTKILGGDLIFPEQLGTDDRCIFIDGLKLEIGSYANIDKAVYICGFVDDGCLVLCVCWNCPTSFLVS